MLDWVIYIGLLFWSNTTKLEIKDDGGGGGGLSETLIENIRQNRTLYILEFHMLFSHAFHAIQVN